MSNDNKELLETQHRLLEYYRATLEHVETVLQRAKEKEALLVEVIAEAKESYNTLRDRYSWGSGRYHGWVGEPWPKCWDEGIPLKKDGGR